MNSEPSTLRGDRRRGMKRISFICCLLAVAVALSSRDAVADIPLAKVNGWDVSLDGRLNTFASVSQGDVQPTAVPTWAGGVEDRAAGTDRTILMTRIRSGFITNVFGISLVKELSPDVRVTGRVAIWVGVSQARDKSDNPALDAREVYTKVEGPWGGILAGRNLSLFERGAIMMDYDIQHGYGLGHPCAVRTVRGGACGYAGHGILFPSFNAGVVYNTPDIAGLQLSVGAYDPAAIAERQFERTPYPRVEAELSYHFHTKFRLFADMLWQRLGSNTDSTLNPDANGVAAGASVAFGPFAAGLAYYGGQGLGLYVPMENSPLFSDEMGVLRKSRGFVGMASLTFRDTKVAGGAGVTQLMKTSTEPVGPFPALTIPKRQIGISAGVYQTFSKTLIVALEYFRGDYQWYDTTDVSTMAAVQNKQGVNFVNAGVTLVW